VPLATIETDLLILRPLCLDDLDRLTQLHAQESFWRYPFGRGWSGDETKDFLDRTQTHYSDPGIAVCAVVIREANELAGWAGCACQPFCRRSFQRWRWAGGLRPRPVAPGSATGLTISDFARS
jgi:Acetyltransferase (GNAT) domain